MAELLHFHRWTVYYDHEWKTNPVRRCKCKSVQVQVDGRWIDADLRHKFGDKVWVVTSSKTTFNSAVAYFTQAFHVEQSVEFLPLLTENDWDKFMTEFQAGIRPRLVLHPSDWFMNDFISRTEFTLALSHSMDML